MYRRTVCSIFYKKLFQKFQILARRPVRKGLVEGEGTWSLKFRLYCTGIFDGLINLALAYGVPGV